MFLPADGAVRKWSTISSFWTWDMQKRLNDSQMYTSLCVHRLTEAFRE